MDVSVHHVQGIRYSQKRLVAGQSGAPHDFNITKLEIKTPTGVVSITLYDREKAPLTIEKSDEWIS